MFLHVSVIPFTGGVVSQHALQQVSKGGWYPSMPCRFQGPHPGEKLMGLARGGLQAHTQGGSWGVWPGGSRPTPGGVSRPTPRGVCIPACTEAEPPPPLRWLLLQVVRILMECILVLHSFSHVWICNEQLMFKILRFQTFYSILSFCVILEMQNSPTHFSVHFLVRRIHVSLQL